MLNLDWPVGMTGGNIPDLESKEEHIYFSASLPWVSSAAKADLKLPVEGLVDEPYPKMLLT